jgi:hypothetical protein
LAHPAYYYYLRSRNEILLWRKHCPFRCKAKAALRIAHRAVGTLERLAGHRELTDAVLAGLWDGLRGMAGRYEPSRRMPASLASLLRANPSLLRRVLDKI